MYHGKKITITIPAYNEEKLIGKVLEKIPPFIDNLIIVNDGSTDNTENAVLEWEKKDKRIIYIKNEKNLGVGGTITRGMNEAKKIKTDIALVMAGDDQCNPDYLKALIDPVVNNVCDYAKANRFYSREGLKGMPKHRVFGSIILTFMTRLASGYWTVFDTQNGYGAIGAKAFYELDYDKLSSAGYAYENELLLNLNILGMRVKDIPVPSIYGDEVSTIKLWKIIPLYMYFLTAGFFRRIYRKYILRGFHPIALFFLSGSFLFWWGVIFGILKWRDSSITGIPATTGTVMLAALPLLMGFEMILWGFVLDIQEEPK